MQPTCVYIVFISTASLKINDAQEEDQGPYECIAENKVGTAYSEQATLYVKSKLSFSFKVVHQRHI